MTLDPSEAARSSLDSSRRWRLQAAHVREHVDAKHLTPGQRIALLREAAACDRQADWWRDAATMTADPQAGPQRKGTTLRPPRPRRSQYRAARQEMRMSRHQILARTSDLTVVVGWDNPLGTFFAQVMRAEDTEDDSDPVPLWLGGFAGEVLRAEDLIAPLAPYAELDEAAVAQLRADRAAGTDRGPTPLQRDMLARLGRAP
ncbi:MAG: hypothetical protein ABI369_16115 [Acetobacteraceae bacterium]